MNVAYTVWTWMMEEFGREEPTEAAERHFEEAVRSISYLGYDSIENFNFIVPLYEKRPEDLKKLLDQYGLQLVNLYHTYYEDDVDKWLDLGERTCKLLQYCGAKYINVQGNIQYPDAPVDKDALKMYSETFSKMGEISKKYGVQTCMHPHWGTRMYWPEAIDYFYEITDNDLVKMTIDTAHTTLAGIDPVKQTEKYIDIIKYVHFKDVAPDPIPAIEKAPDKFRALGQGTVDFEGVLKVLKKHGYNGTICVEHDNPKICSYESAEYSRKYLKATLGL